jgi:hypothetical protein
LKPIFADRIEETKLFDLNWRCTLHQKSYEAHEYNFEIEEVGCMPALSEAESEAEHAQEFLHQQRIDFEQTHSRSKGALHFRAYRLGCDLIQDVSEVSRKKNPDVRTQSILSRPITTIQQKSPFAP